MPAINNRKYTGLLRTPSSAAWLIKKRAATAGSIERKNRRINSLRVEREELKALLKHIDSVISQHEVQLSPELIDPRPPKRQTLGNYGDMSRYVFKRLKEANGEPISTTDLAIGYLSHLGREVTMQLLRDARCRMAWRMKDMARDGKVIPRHIESDRGNVTEGRWLLADMGFEEITQSAKAAAVRVAPPEP